MRATDGLESRYNPRRVAEKQKEKGGGVASGCKQATPTGFGDLRAKQDLSRPVNDVGNDEV